MTASLSELAGEFEKALERVEMIEENLARKMLDLEDIGWERLEGNSDDASGLTLKALHKLAPNLREMAAKNPLHKRGAQLRHSYVFGRGINFENVKDKTQASIDNPYNQTSLFSVQAYETNNLALFTDGNFFVIRNKDDIFTVVPIEQISAVFTDPDDASKIQYIQRTWNSVDLNGKSKPMKRWYPVSRYKKTQVGRGRRGTIPKSIANGAGERIPVDQESVIYHHTTQRQSGWTFGIPDSLAASVYTVAYSNYISDNALLVKSLSQIAWTITNATKKGGANTAMSIAQPGVGGTAITGMGNAISSVGVPSAQVNFNNGQPLAALVAASFGVPVIALLSSPGATGGSYGAAQTLDFPTTKTMQAIQDSWTLFYKEILQDLGSPDIQIEFPSIETDPAYREIQSIATAVSLGLLHRDEGRIGVLDILDVPRLHKDLPEPDEFITSGNTNDPVARQGNTGAVPGGFNQDTTDNGED